MRIKTIVIVLVTILLTIIIMQNAEKVWFNVLFFNFRMSKLIMLLFVAIVGFILGYLVGRPKRAIRLGGDHDEHDHDSDKPGTLSDEDREYIN